MKHDALTQVRAFFEDLDAGLPPIDPTDVAGEQAVRTEPGRGGPTSTVKPLKVVRRWRGPAVVVASAIGVVAVFAVVFLLRSGGATDDARVVDTGPTVTTTAGALVDPPDMEWDRNHVPAFAEGSMHSVTAPGDGPIVAVGTASDGYSSDAAVWISSDGTQWERIVDDGAFSGLGEGLDDNFQQMTDVAVWSGGFVAVGSADTERAASEGLEGFGAAAVWLSIDGVAWERVPHQPALEEFPGSLKMSAVTSGGPGLVAVGQEFTSEPWQFGPGVWVSEDGRSWDRVPQDRLPDVGVVLKDVTSTGSRLFAVGTYEGGKPVMWWSDDGLDWQSVTVPCSECEEGGWSVAVPGLGSGWGAGIAAVGASEHGLVAVGMVDEAGERPVAGVWLSRDGIEWDPPVVFDSPERPYDVMARDVAWDGDRIVVAVQERSDTGRFRGVVWVSPDAGGQWFEVARDESPVELDIESEDATNGLALVPGGVVVVGDTGYSWVGGWAGE